MNNHLTKHTLGKRSLVFSIVLMMMFLIIGMISFLSRVALVHAASFTVNIPADATDDNPGDGVCEIAGPPWGICTLRAAIEETNALAGTDEIIIPAGVFVSNRTGSDDDNAFAGDLDITDDLIVRGDSNTTTFIDGGAIDRVLHITGSVAVTISNVTIRNGAAADGAGILNDGGEVTLISTTIRSNHASINGGGIYNASANGSVSLAQSSLISNTALASGGAVYNDGVLALVNSTVSTNTAVSLGGGIIQKTGTMTVTNSTFSGNSAADGGAIYHNDGAAWLTNATINQNTAALGAGITQLSGVVTIKNSIVSNSITGSDCTGTIVSTGNNLDSDSTCSFTEVSDLSGVDPLLEPLQDNGGPTFTHALQFGSPAINAGDDVHCLATDQRGAARYATCDIGAYEFEIYLQYLPLVLNEIEDTTPPPSNSCHKQVPVFTTDSAPTDGTLEFHVLYGELGRIEGITLYVWDVSAGQQINNDKVAVTASKWVRIWWQPDGDTTWYLLPSQYWTGDGTAASEYGVSCGDYAVPSYHTSFGSAIPEDDVPFFTLPLLITSPR